MRPGSCNVIKKSLHFCLLQSLENLTRGISSPASGWELRSLWSTVQSYRHLNSKTATTVSGQSFKSPTLCRDQCKMTPLPSPSGAFAGGEPHTLERRPSPSALCPPPGPPSCSSRETSDPSGGSEMEEREIGPSSYLMEQLECGFVLFRPGMF